MKASLDEVVWDYAAGVCGGLAAALIVVQYMDAVLLGDGLELRHFAVAVGVTLGFYLVLIAAFLATKQVLGEDTKKAGKITKK